MMRKTALFTSLALILGAAPALAANDPNAATPDEVVTKVHEAVQHLNDQRLGRLLRLQQQQGCPLGLEGQLCVRL